MTLKRQPSESVTKLFSISLLIIFFTSFSEYSSAADYYIHPAGTANWSQCTSISNPCSVATAMQSANAGDTVNFRGGTYSITGTRTSYHGLIEPENSGTASSPIIFQAYSNEVPIISVNCTSSDNICNAIGTNAKDYITWDGFTLTALNNKTAGIFIGGESTSTGAVFKNSTVIAGSLPVTNADNRDITRMEKTINATYSNNIVGGLKSTDRTVNASNNACLKMYSNDNAIINNNEFFGCPTGISAKSRLNNASIHHNFFHDNYKDFESHVYGNGVTRNSINNTISHNIFSKAGRKSLNVTANESGKASNWVVYNNTFYSDGNGTFDRHYYHGASENLEFYNNILIASGEQFSTVENFSTLDSMDHNNFGTGSLFIELRRYGNSEKYTSFSNWQSSGELNGGGSPGAGSFASDPLFVNISGSMSQIADFGLSSSSPSKAAGRSGVDMGANVSLVGPDHQLKTPKWPIPDSIVQ